MDLTTVTAVLPDPQPSDWQPGDAWLAGGTWLFSVPQPSVTRLLDLTSLGWAPLTVRDDGLEVAATCTVAALAGFTAPTDRPHPWLAVPLFGQCARALLASFKVAGVATVGGNLCNALPAGAMISLTAALDGVVTLWAPDGTVRTLPVPDLVIGDNRTSLRPGELVRSVHLPERALQARTAMRQVSLTTNGRSAALVIAREDLDGTFTLTVTASVVAPVVLRLPAAPSAARLRALLGETIPHPAYHDDVHGDPAWRRHLTFLLAEQVRAELAGPAEPAVEAGRP